MLCTTPVDQSRSRQTSFSYTAHHLAVYEKRQVTQNLFISTQCQGGSGKRKCSSAMSRLNIRELIEQRLSSLFQPGYKKRDTTHYSISLFYCQKSWCGMVFMAVLRNFPTATDFNFIFQKYPRIRDVRRYLELERSIILFGRCNGFLSE